MRPSGIVKGVDISAYGGPCLRDTGVGPQVHLLVFDGPPQALDEDVVSPGAFPIHADLDLVLEQQAADLNLSGLSPAVRRSCAAPMWPIELRATRFAASSSTIAAIITSRSAISSCSSR